MELSPDLISACLALEEVPGEPPKLSPSGSWYSGALGLKGGLFLPSTPSWLLLVHSVSLCFGSWAPQDPSWELVGEGSELESWSLERHQGGGRAKDVTCQQKPQPWFLFLPGLRKGVFLLYFF